MRIIDNISGNVLGAVLVLPILLGMSIIMNIIVWVPTSIAIIKCLQYLNIIGG